MKILVSACLLGENCKYNGKNNCSDSVFDFVTGHEVIAVCPEIFGGLGVPRSPAEIVGGQVINKDGKNVTQEYINGAETALNIALENGVDIAVLQSRSPSCGVKQIYDGSFSGTLVDGKGIFAELLEKHNIKIVDVEDIEK